LAVIVEATSCVAQKFVTNQIDPPPDFFISLLTQGEHDMKFSSRQARLMLLMLGLALAGDLWARGGGGYQGGGGRGGGGGYQRGGGGGGRGGGAYHGGGGGRGGYYGGGHRGGGWGGYGHRGGYRGYGGFGFYWGPSFGWPYYYPSYPYYASPPVVVAPPSPPVYIERTDPAPSEENYWHYCENPQGYYPYVKECPGGWTPVPSTPPQ
jgi:hypothetical protein